MRRKLGLRLDRGLGLEGRPLDHDVFLREAVHGDDGADAHALESEVDDGFEALVVELLRAVQLDQAVRKVVGEQRFPGVGFESDVGAQVRNRDGLLLGQAVVSLDALLERGEVLLGRHAARSVHQRISSTPLAERENCRHQNRRRVRECPISGFC